MLTNADRSSEKHSTSEGAESDLAVHQQRIFTAPLPDPISQSIEAITSLHRQAAQDIPAHEKVLETITAFFGRPGFLYSLLVGLLGWFFGSLLSQANVLPIAIPRFSWSQQGLDAAALLISTGVLVRQTRQENFAEQRSQLTLQLNLLSDQKIAKVIALLEELRTDLPNVLDRKDLEAQAMQEAADPIQVLEALQENLAQELASDALTDSLKPENGVQRDALVT